MEFQEVVARRRMVRNYRDEPVDAAVVERIVDTARRAPSAGFTQGQRFVVVTEARTRRAIADLADEDAYVERGFDPWMSRAPVHVVLCAHEGAYHDRYRQPDKLGRDRGGMTRDRGGMTRDRGGMTRDRGETRRDRGETTRDRGETTRDRAEVDWPVPYWHVDAGASLMLLLLAAVDERLAAGFFGAHRLDGLQELLGIPSNVHPVGVVTLGHPAPDRRSGSLERGWHDLEEVVHRERWG